MSRVKAKCIKETYTWEGDGKEHSFPYVKLGLVYDFDKTFDGDYPHLYEYWLDKSTLQNKSDYDFIDCCQRGLAEKYFKQMFEIVG